MKKGPILMQQPLLPPAMGYPMMYPNQPPMQMQFRNPVNYGLPSIQ